MPHPRQNPVVASHLNSHSSIFGLRGHGRGLSRLSNSNDAVCISLKLLRDDSWGIEEISNQLESGVGSVYGAFKTATFKKCQLVHVAFGLA